MRSRESRWIRDTLERYGQGAVSPLLHLGSSSAEFREVRKPHIHAQLFAPLESAGFDVVHADIKDAPGVDMVGDVGDPAFIAALRARRFRAVLVSNLLEHVRDAARVAAACEEIAGPGGLIVFTGPYRYPFHADPIDTMFRPAPAELTDLFARCRLIEAEVLRDGGPVRDIVAGGWRQVALFPVKLVWRLAGFPFRPAVARTEWHRLLWFGRGYEIVCAVLRVEPAAQAAP